MREVACVDEAADRGVERRLGDTTRLAAHGDEQVRSNSSCPLNWTLPSRDLPCSAPSGGDLRSPRCWL
jgi:hypothetical protein